MATSLDLRTSPPTCLIEPFSLPHPNIPPGIKLLPIHPISLWPVGSIPSVLVFPGGLDRQRLGRAIRRVASVWPNVCGRYVERSPANSPERPKFFFELTDSGIPLEVQTIERESAFDTSHVVQSNIDDYCLKLSPDFFKPNSDAPLLAFRLTTLLPTGHSVLGMRWAHILGDASSCLRFLQDLSHFYTHGADAELSAEEHPTFLPHILLPDEPLRDEVLGRYSHWHIQAREMAEMAAGYAKAREENEPVVVTLSAEEMARIRADCQSGAEGRRLSDQDAISGWWVSVLRRAGVGLHHMVYTVNYRTLHTGHASFPPNLPTLSANVAQMRRLALPPPHADLAIDMANTGRAIRSELEHLRSDPSDTLDWLSVAAFRLEDAAVRGMAQCLVPPAGECMVNSNFRYSWNVPFGFPPDQVAFHTSFSCVRFLRVFRANPKRGDAHCAASAELVFDVPKGGSAKAEVLSIVDGDRKWWASP